MSLAGIKRALVTGASGFFGRRLAARLEQAGVEVTRVSRRHGIDLVRDPLPIDGADVVYHLAGRTYVVDAWREPTDFFHVNAYGTARVLEACAKAKTPIVYASAYIYGPPQRLPIDERHPVTLNNPYGFSKYMGEEACRFYASTFGVPATILRIFNVFGPGQEKHFLIPTILDQAIDDGADEIVVADLNPRRDYIYVDDLVEATIAATGHVGVFNVGAGTSYSVRDLIVAALEVSGRSKPFRDRGERRPNEVDDVVADITAIREATGWAPKVSLREGLERWVAGQ